MAKGSGGTRRTDSRKNRDLSAAFNYLNSNKARSREEVIGWLNSHGYNDLAEGIEGWIDGNALFDPYYKDKYTDAQRKAFTEWVKSGTYTGTIYRGIELETDKAEEFIKEIKKEIKKSGASRIPTATLSHNKNRELFSFSSNRYSAYDYATRMSQEEEGFTPILVKHTGTVRGINYSKAVKATDSEIIVYDTKDFKVKKVTKGYDPNIDVEYYEITVGR